MNIQWARIFIVDDDKIIRTLIMGYLRRLGINDFHEFEDGSAALAAVIRLRPDLILTDIHMNPMGGLEFVKLLRGMSDNRLSNTQVIFLSADKSKGTVEEALPLGVTGYLVKPPTMAALQARVEQALSS